MLAIVIKPYGNQSFTQSKLAILIDFAHLYVSVSILSMNMRIIAAFSSVVDSVKQTTRWKISSADFIVRFNVPCASYLS